MNAEQLMNAIGGISDRHIAEFAEIQPIASKKSVRFKIASIAACLCLFMTSTVFFVHKKTSQSGEIPQGEIVWGSNIQEGELAYYIGKSAKGSVIITESLQRTMEEICSAAINAGTAYSENDKRLFAVLVTETTGLSKEEVYNTFIKPLGVEENYLATGVIFVTKEQIDSFTCPFDFALVLSPAEKPNG